MKAPDTSRYTERAAVLFIGLALAVANPHAQAQNPTLIPLDGAASSASGDLSGRLPAHVTDGIDLNVTARVIGFDFTANHGDKNNVVSLNELQFFEATDPVAAAEKILFLGNSITWHAPKPSIGWYGNWGMAASSLENDYVHILSRSVSEITGTPPEIMVENIAAFESNYETYDLALLNEHMEFGADTVILAIGENVRDVGSEDSRIRFRAGVLRLLNALKDAGNPTIIVRSSFWPDEVEDNILKSVAEEVGGVFVDISGLSNDESNYAREHAHEGVAAHPSDKGMQAIADLLLEAIDWIAPRTWDNGAGDNNWANGTNWDPDGDLASGDYLSITSGTPVAGSDVQIADGGRLIVSGGDVTWSGPFHSVGDTSQGTVSITGGSLTVDYDGGGAHGFHVGNTAAGRLRQEEGIVTAANDNDEIFIGNQAGGSGRYEISGGTLSAGRIHNGNAGSGTLHITGDAATIGLTGSAGSSYSQNAASALKLEINGGISPIDAAGDVTLGGTLEVRLATIPTVGQEFVIISYGGSLAGTFATFDNVVDSPLGANTVNLALDYGDGSDDQVKIIVTAVDAGAFVSDFSNFVESGNTLSGGNSREQSYTPSGAEVTIAHVSGGGAGQEFYLSGEFATLAEGDRISVDLKSATTTTFEMFGLALTNSTTPGADQLMWSWRAPSDLHLSVRTASSGAGSEIVNLSGVPDTLFIERTATGWSFGSITFGSITSNSVETVHFSDISSSPTNATPITVDGSVVGFFSDMRSETNPKTLSNLRIVQTGGNQFNDWISDAALGLDPAEQGFALDPDGDGVANGLEAFFGTNPSVASAGLNTVSMIGNTLSFLHANPDTPLDDVTGSYEWSLDMNTWYTADGLQGDGSTTVMAVPTPDSPAANTTTVACTMAGIIPARLFIRVLATTP